MRARGYWAALGLALTLALPVAGFAAPSEARVVSQSTSLSSTVRVWLSSLGGATTLNLTLDGNYALNGSQSLPQGSSATVSYEGGTLYFTTGGTRTNMGTQFVLRRSGGSGYSGIKIAQSRNPSYWYNGDMELAARNGRLYAIAYLGIEDYLMGVVPYEMSNSFPLEALKAQSVAARTYALSKMAGRAAYYDVVDTTADQIYRGLATGLDRVRQAVEGTRGEVAMSGGSYISALYTASNGGQTESVKNAWNSSGYSYLDVHDDPYDVANASSPVRSYTFSGSGSNGYAVDSLIKTKIASQLSAKGYSTANVSISGVTNVTAHTPKYASPSRLYTKVDVTVRVNAGGQTVSGLTATLDYFSELESLLGMSINGTANELISVDRVGSDFRLNARRYGHGIGMSQRGAQQMGNQGMNYLQIIGFYYPGVTLVEYDFGGTTLPPITGTIPDATQQPEQPMTPGDGTATVTLDNPSSWLNMRSGPGTENSILAQLRHGTTVTVLGSNGGWCQIQYNNLTGYVMQSYLVLSTPVATPVPTDATPTPVPTGLDVTPTPAPTGTPDVQYVGQVTLPNHDERVNLRSAPNTNSNIILRLTDGTRVDVLAEQGDWLSVRVGETYGYIMRTYVDRIDGMQVTTPEPGATPPPVVTDAPVATTPPPVTPPPADGQRLALINVPQGQTLNLRSGPNTTYPVLAQIPSGMVVSYTQYTAGWCAVTYNGWQGYVMTSYLTTMDEPLQTAVPAEPTQDPNQPPVVQPTPNDTEPSAMQTATVVLQYSNSRLNMRTAQSTNASVVTTVPYGASVQVLQYGPTWCEVIYQNTRGYVATDYLRFDGVASPATVAPTPFAPPSAPGDASTFTLYVHVDGVLNLRSGPGSNHGVITTLANGTPLTAYEYVDGWYKVRWGEGFGYVLERYVLSDPNSGQSNMQMSQLMSSEATPSPPPQMATEVIMQDATPTPQEDSTPTPQVSAVATPTPVRTPEPTEVPRPDPVDPNDVINRGTVRPGSGISAHERPKSSSDTVGTIPHDATVEILDYEGANGDWCLVAYDWIRGYVRREDLTQEYVMAAVNPSGDSGGLTMYAEPFAESEALGQTNSGIVRVKRVENDWVLVRTMSDREGYVMVSGLNIWW